MLRQLTIRIKRVEFTSQRLAGDEILHVDVYLSTGANVKKYPIKQSRFQAISTRAFLAVDHEARCYHGSFRLGVSVFVVSVEEIGSGGYLRMERRE
jgi:hypothetical protein